MNNAVLLLIKKRTNTPIEQPKTKPKKTLDFNLNKQMEAFPFNPPINLFQKSNWLLAVNSFETTEFSINISKKNNGFSITIQGHSNSESTENSINELNNLSELRSQNDIEVHVEQVRKKILLKN